MSKVFISYRRADTKGIAGRIYDRLVQKFGEADVFMDVDSIRGGSEFPTVLAETLSLSQVVIVLIGDKWLSSHNEGQKRLDNPSDYVRREVAAGLNSDALVIPVLIDQTRMPCPNQLPADIRKIAELHARPIRNGNDFHKDVDKLLEDISRSKPSALAPLAGQRHTPLAGSIPSKMVELLADLWYKRKHEDQSTEAMATFAKAFPTEFRIWGGSGSMKKPDELAAVILRCKYEFPSDILSECQEVCESKAKTLANENKTQQALELISSLPVQHQNHELLRSIGEQKKELAQNYARIRSALSMNDLVELRKAAEKLRDLVPNDKGFPNRVARKWHLLGKAFSSLAGFPKDCVEEFRRIIEILRFPSGIFIFFGGGLLLSLTFVLMSVFGIAAICEPPRVEWLGWMPPDHRPFFWRAFYLSVISNIAIGSVTVVWFIWASNRKAKYRKVLRNQLPYSTLFDTLDFTILVKDDESLLIILDAINYRFGSENIAN